MATDAYPRIVGPTGRGLTADILTYSHTDGQQTLGLGSSTKTSGTSKRKRADAQGVPSSLETAFLLDSPGEFEVHHVLITGVQTPLINDYGQVLYGATLAGGTSSALVTFTPTLHWRAASGGS